MFNGNPRDKKRDVAFNVTRCFVASQVELKIPTAEDWITDFAIPQKFDSRIIGFLSFKGGNLHKVDYEDNQKFVTPRGWERVNTLIKGVKNSDL